MHCHIVWCAVSVFVGDVMNCTDCHGDLTNGIHDGQVDDGSAWRNCWKLEILSLHHRLLCAQS